MTTTPTSSRSTLPVVECQTQINLGTIYRGKAWWAVVEMVDASASPIDVHLAGFRAMLRAQPADTSPAATCDCHTSSNDVGLDTNQVSLELDAADTTALAGSSYVGDLEMTLPGADPVILFGFTVSVKTPVTR